MRQEHGKIDGDLLLAEDLELRGMVTGTITVSAGKSLALYGMCGGDLVIEAGARASIDGTVAGNVTNNGIVEVRGMVLGSVQSQNGTVRYSKEAMVGGTRG
jgi:cytoskeletal protein CcmA (bactofilin family)